MFRKRGLIRPLQRPFSPDIPPAVQRANELMVSGDYNGAAVAFEQLARGAEGRVGPRAPHFFMDAARARFKAGQKSIAMEHAHHALELLASSKRWPAFQMMGENIATFLNKHGMSQEAQEISDYLKATLPSLPANQPGMQSFTRERTRSRIPTVCPGCGGPLRSDEVEWLDETTAECPYCGSAVRGE